MDRRGRRTWVAIGAALALHALLLCALALLPKAPGPVRSLRVSLLRVPVHAPAPARVLPGAPDASTGASRAAPGRSEDPRVAERARAPSAQRGSSARPEGVARLPGTPVRDRAGSLPAARERPAASAKAPSPGAPDTRDFRVAEGIDRSGDGLRTRLDHPEDALPAAPGPTDESLGLVREKTRAEKLAEEKLAVGRKVEGWASDARARERAENGRDRYWQTLEDALARGFDPGWDLLDQGPKDSAGGRTRTFLDSWQQQAEAYGKSGSPFAGAADAPGARRPLQQEVTGLANEDRGLASVSLGRGLAPSLSLGMMVAGAALAGTTWNHQLIATVRITQREDGTLVAAELTGTSGNAAYDRMVLRKARALGELRLGAPKQGRDTLWAFETNFTQIPPVPIAGCALDDFIPKNCWHPLQKSSRSRVRLLAIY